MKVALKNRGAALIKDFEGPTPDGWTSKYPVKRVAPCTLGAGLNPIRTTSDLILSKLGRYVGKLGLKSFKAMKGILLLVHAYIRYLRRSSSAGIFKPNPPLPALRLPIIRQLHSHLSYLLET